MVDAAAGRGVQIWTDGACSGNPGPGGWGALLRYGEHERELCGGEATPTTNNRMELMAAIQALESLTRPVDRAAAHRQHVRAQRHHQLAGVVEAQRLADRREAAGEERRPVAAAGGGLRPARGAPGSGSRGTTAHPENERADGLANKGMTKARAALTSR